jgi:hypothetical protein
LLFQTRNAADVARRRQVSRLDAIPLEFALQTGRPPQTKSGREHRSIHPIIIERKGPEVLKSLLGNLRELRGPDGTRSKPAWAPKVHLGPQELTGGSGGAVSRGRRWAHGVLGALRCPLEERTSNVRCLRSADGPEADMGGRATVWPCPLRRYGDVLDFRSVRIALAVQACFRSQWPKLKSTVA